MNFLTVKQAAEILGIQPRMVRRWCQRNKIGKKIGNQYLITPQELEEFHRPKPGPKPK